MLDAVPAASTWETECFISAAIAGTTAIAVVATSIARRRSAGSTVVRQLLVALFVAIFFVVILAYMFATVEPCAQGPA